MIEKKFVLENIKEFQIHEFISKRIKNAGHSQTKLKRTPLGEKIIIYCTRPGMVVGRKGATIKELTENLKNKFKLDNPQLEIAEVDNPNMDASIVAERIASSLERFGPQKFKGVGHKVMEDVIGSGALGIEILISGKIPGARAKKWRFYQGYLKKCGNIAMTGVSFAIKEAQLKTGTIGIQVRIMPPNIVLPDRIKILDEASVEVIEEDLEEKEEPAKEKKTKPKKEAQKKKTKKKPAKPKGKKQDSPPPKGKGVKNEVQGT